MLTITIIILIIVSVWTTRSIFIHRHQAFSKQLKSIGLLCGSVLMLLVLTKKIHILGLMLAALIPLIQKVVTLSIRFAPFIGKIIHSYQKNQSTNTQSNSSSHTRTQKDQEMTTKEALDILGLTEEATKDQILSQHRKLIQKLHPDKGGSHFLTAKINQARDLLLKNC